MKKYTSKEAYYNRMKSLAVVGKTSVNESGSRNLGTLIDFERAANGVAYGIIKESHKYYIKKGGLNESQNVADFAYIGGLGNITNFEYSRLAEAKKNRNFLLQTLNEGFQPKVEKKTKKTILTEDKASKEIGDAEGKLGDLEAATDAAAVADVPAIAPDAGEEMAAGIEDMPVDAPADDMGDVAPAADPLAGGAEMPLGDEIPPEGGEEMPLGDEIPPEGDVEVTGDEEEVAIEDPESETEREIEKSLGKLTNKLRKTELTDSQVKSYVNTFLSAFKDKFPDIEIEDRKEMAEKITKVVPAEDIEDLGQNVEDTEASDEITASEPEELEVAEQQKCAECGGFAQYAESRGYTAESIQECGAEEMTNMISGYANAHDEGQNDGDFKAIALFITPEIIEKLKGDYGHDNFANQVEPFSNEMNETSAEDKAAQINELFGGLGHMAKKAGQGIKQGAQNLGQNIAQKAGQVQQAVGQAATNVKQTYHAGEKNAALGKLEKVAADLGKQIASVNKHAEKSGQPAINVKSILSTISNQVAGSAGTADLSKFRANEEGIPVDSVEVQPMMEDAAIEEDVNIKVVEKQGKKLSPDNTPEVEMKEGEEKEGEDIDIDNLDVSAEDDAPTVKIAEPEGDVLDLTKDRKQPDAEFGVGFDPMGGGVVKPEGAEVTTVEVTKDSVKVEMNESEIKLRKYIRNRLEEHAGLKKPLLTETKKSETLQKLDKTIEKQFELYESTIKEGWGEKIANTMGRVSQGLEGRLKKQKELKNILSTISAEDDNALNSALQYLISGDQYSAGVGQYIPRTDTAKKFEILQQAANDPQGLGKLKLGNGGIVYVPVSHTGDSGPSGFATGRSRLGEEK